MVQSNGRVVHTQGEHSAIFALGLEVIFGPTRGISYGRLRVSRFYPWDNVSMTRVFAQNALSSINGTRPWRSFAHYSPG